MHAFETRTHQATHQSMVTRPHLEESTLRSIAESESLAAFQSLSL